MRLIDADALKEKSIIICDGPMYNQVIPIKALIDAPTVDTYTEDDVENAIKGYEAGYERAKAKFKNPTGHWIKTISENGVTSAARCSECGFGDNRYMWFRFCPNCGADMQSN